MLLLTWTWPIWAINTYHMTVKLTQNNFSQRLVNIQADACVLNNRRLFDSID